MKARWTLLLVLAVGPAAMACERPAVATAPHVAMVSTTDFAFDAPDEVPAGLVTFRMNAGGNEMHHMQIVRLEEGRTFADLEQALQTPGPPPRWVTFIGGPNGADPGDTQETTVHLEPGEHALICLIPSPDGVPHFAKGMMRPLAVTGTAEPAERPDTDVVLTMRDYTFHLSERITAGERRILVENQGVEPHEVVLVRLADGASAHDVVAWVEGGMHGPPPGTGAGGTSAISQGGWNLVHAEFESGARYALLCFIPGPDGRPHVALGMVQEIAID